MTGPSGLTAVAAPHARLLIVALLPVGRFGVRGARPEEMRQRFTAGWKMLSTGLERQLDEDQTPVHYYLYRCEGP